ncbi:MAG: 50S ribosome-binding GTPase, partial [Gammaproteobacteria bacterium]|nr:50S ribosome-binding GTPase [Gammaproteobacteria bacterium]
MTKTTEIRVPANQIPVSRRADASIAVVGNPNSGKSTLFNRLTGLRQRIGNYPGVTVERHIGTLKVGERSLELVDLPGTHALSAHSLEEQIAVDVILGHMEGTATPDGILAVVDATSLYQGLYLVQQLLDLEKPLVVALTMSDAAELDGLKINISRLTAKLGGVPVCPVVATSGQGVDKLREELARITEVQPPEPGKTWPELTAAARELASMCPETVRLAEVERLLIDGPTEARQGFLARFGEGAEARLQELRDRLFGNEPPLASEARVRYRWVREVLDEVVQQAPPFYG